MSSQDNLLSLDRISIVYNKKVADAANVANHTLKVLKNSGLQAIVDIAPFPDYNASLVITVGGDGTIHEVVNGIFIQKKVPTTDISLAVIPTGTGNDWIRMFGISKTIRRKTRSCS